VEPNTQTVMAGRTAQYQVWIDSLHGFDQSLSLSFTGLPEGAAGSFSTRVISVSETAILSVATELEMPVGSYDFWVEGRSGSVSKASPATLIVQGPPQGVIPNPFTPNGDGYNDFVYFNYPGIITNQGTISIYNFNGKKVKEIFGYNRWYGTNDNGDDLSSGVYLYIVKIAGVIKGNGTITLVR